MKVACVYDGKWINLETGAPSSGPKKDEVCKVVFSIQLKERWNATYIKLQGWEAFGYYPLSCFRPIVDDFGERICKQIEETIIEKELV